MSNSTIVWPVRVQDHQWLLDMGLTDVPEVTSSPVTARQVRMLLEEMRWPYAERVAQGTGPGTDGIIFSCALRDHAWPPSPRSACLRTAPGFDTEAILRMSWPATPRVPTGRWSRSTRAGRPALVTPELSYEEWAHAFGYRGDRDRDSAWVPARSGD